MDAHYNLSCSLYGHEKDVRGLAPLYQPNGAFVSVSRDITSKVWVQNESDVSYQEGMSLGGHENFVSCVCVLPPDSDHPHGLILTGSNDCSILAYTINSPAPIFKLTGHTNAVCALAAGKFGMFVSGSWDHTARLWVKQEHITTFIGHEAAVWCVALLPGDERAITGSADKTIRLWKEGKVQHVFKGHTDCVRGLAIMDPNHFLSCANDTTIRLWELSGTCHRIFTGHTNYVYSLACLSPNMEFASCGEDRSLKIWKKGECIQTIAHPTQSVWCVCALPNGDIATGASDGVVRIFTQDPSRVAEPQVISEYQESVAKSSIPAQIGDIKTEELPGPDALHIPGKKEGQTLMIRRKNAIEAYQWSQLKGEWQKVGDVVGGESSGSKEKDAMFEGEKYDYVFDVNLSEGQPMLKLPYNLTEDPYMAAHKFLERNDLSPLFLDQVAAFIQQQTGSVTLGETGSTFVDPYTGASRYVMGNKLPTENGQSSPKPFAGSQCEKKSDWIYFPEKEFIKFEQININGVIGKLEQFNDEVGQEASVKNTDLQQIKFLLTNKSTSTQETRQTILRMLDWPSELLFPVLDVLRYVFLSSDLFGGLLSLKEPSELLQLFFGIIDQDNVKNRFLVMRAICNLFQHSSGRKVILDNASILLENVAKLKACTDKNLQVAVSSFFLNLSVLTHQLNDDMLKSSILSNISDFLTFVSDEEAFFRYIVALGTVAISDEIYVAVIKSLGLDVCLKTHRFRCEPPSEKVKKSSDSLLALLS